MRKTSTPPTNLDDYESGDDLELQVRQVMQSVNKPRVEMVIYAWLSDKRKKDNEENKKWGWRYCPFKDNERFILTYRDKLIKGKINTIDRDYYGGDCLVLYTELDKRSGDTLTKINAFKR